MNILIYSHIALWTIHHAETVEIALKHLAEGDTVYILSCDGDLVSCPANPNHDKSLCLSCKHQTDYTLREILKNKVHDLRVSLYHDKLTFPEFSSLNELVEFKFNDIPFGELVASQLVDDERDCFFSLDNKQLKVCEMLSNSISLYKHTRHIIKDKKIDKTYVWNGRRCSDGPVCYAARDEQVSFEVYISGGKKNTYITLAALKVHDLAANKVFMDKLYEQAIQNNGIELVNQEALSFFKTQRYGGADYPGFIHFAQEFKDVPEVINNDRKKIVIFTSSYWEYFGMSDYRGGCYVNHYDGIKKILQEDSILTQNDLIIRWHPNLKTCGDSEREAIDKVIRESSENAIHYPPESNVNSYNLIDIADVVITFGSTIGIEANFYGKPSILLGRSLYEDLGACYQPKSHEELVKLLSAKLTPLPKTGSIKYGFYCLNRGENYFKYLKQVDPWNFTYQNKSLQKINQKTWKQMIKIQIIKLLKLLKLYELVRYTAISIRVSKG
jgi:hypothetical protein